MFPQVHQTLWVSFPGIGTVAPKEVLAHGAELCRDCGEGRVIWQKDQRELALAHVLAVVQAVRHLASDFYLPEPQLPTL